MHLETANNYLDAGPHQASLLDDFKKDFARKVMVVVMDQLYQNQNYSKFLLAQAFIFNREGQYNDIDNIMTVL